MAMAAPEVVEKTRFLVPTGELTWEIDVFEGKHTGLVMAEIELDHPDQDFAIPNWLGAEVTEDDRYYNASLSRAPGPPR
jgi:adenylate cyclase